jgi:hypothetical protein
MMGHLSNGEQRSLNYPCRVTTLVERKVRSIYLLNLRSVFPCMIF